VRWWRAPSGSSTTSSNPFGPTCSASTAISLPNYLTAAEISNMAAAAAATKEEEGVAAAVALIAEAAAALVAAAKVMVGLTAAVAVVALIAGAAAEALTEAAAALIAAAAALTEAAAAMTEAAAALIAAVAEVSAANETATGSCSLVAGGEAEGPPAGISAAEATVFQAVLSGTAAIATCFPPTTAVAVVGAIRGSGAVSAVGLREEAPSAAAEGVDQVASPLYLTNLNFYTQLSNLSASAFTGFAL
jgi:hypothetical protein